MARKFADTIAEAAKLLGVSRRSVHDWIASGCPAKSGGRYDLAAIREWRDANRKPARDTAASGELGAVRLRRERERLRQDRLKSRALKREDLAASGNVLSRDEWELFAIEVVQLARDKFMRLPVLLCRHVPQKYHRILRAEGDADVRKICDEMARGLGHGPKD